MQSAEGRQKRKTLGEVKGMRNGEKETTERPVRMKRKSGLVL